MSTDVPDGPTDLYFVGPATATVFDGAPFEARDVAERRVSYRELVDAGVAPEVADRLRREYSLLWAYEWRVGGEDLPRRAAAIDSLDPAERAWIAESASGDDVRAAATSEESPPVAEDEPAACPRCDGALETYELGDSGTVNCSACGYVGIAPR